MLFLLACGVSTVGPGAIAATALVAPLAMATGGAAGIPAFLTALMVGNGANAGNLSPFSAVGLIVQTLMQGAGLGGHGWMVWAANFAAHVLAAAVAWVLFGGLALLGRGRAEAPGADAPMTRAHWVTLAVTAAWIAGVVVFKANPGLSAFAAASVLVLSGCALDGAVLKSIPWPVVLMVCGVSMLVGVLEKTGGMDLFTTILSKVTTPGTVNGAIAFVTGLISTYSSTSGVVYPAFLPAVPGLVQKMGGGDPLQVALSINVGAALVDVSPLSTIGALCLAAVPAGTDARGALQEAAALGPLDDDRGRALLPAVHRAVRQVNGAGPTSARAAREPPAAVDRRPDEWSSGALVQIDHGTGPPVPDPERHPPAGRFVSTDA